MTTDWMPEPADIAAVREARRNGSLRAQLRQQISEGRARLAAAPPTRWSNGTRRDLNGTTCPRCGAGPDQRCHLQTRDQASKQPHEQRIALWAQTVACCTTCQAALGQRCYLDGMPLPAGTVHPARHQDAERTAA
ncbi:hypothetical protein [Streptomyces sp. NPDC005732]|uniref:hypothetical protein n=1 Tax=Streptomyces sp. NPDC005732 TaxID=3157057 RepID=UPI0033C72F2F